MEHRVIDRIAALALALVFCAPAVTMGAERKLTLRDAIRMTLEKNDSIVISKESAAASRARLSGAKGVYEPVFTLSGGWQRTKLPVNSAFSGAPDGEGGPTTRTFDARAALSQYLPSGATLSLHAVTSRETTNGVFSLLSPSYQTNLGVEFRQPLLRDLTTDPQRLAIRVAAADRRRSSAALRVAVTDAVASVERAYWKLAAARAAVGVQSESVRLASEQLSETQAQIDDGAAPPTEIAQPRAELERRRGELLASQEAAARAETGLKILILGDGDAQSWADTLNPQLDSTTTPAPIDRGTAMQQALESRPELELAQAVIDRRKAERAYAGNTKRIGLDAVVSYDRFGLSGSVNPNASDFGGVTPTVPAEYDGGWNRAWGMLNDGNYDDVRAGLELSIPIGNSSARAAEATARHAERQAEAGQTLVRKLVRADVLNAIAAVETASQRMEAARAGRTAAETQLSSEEDRYHVGLSTNFLILTRQNDLSGARLNEISALADYEVARTELARATGALLERYDIHIDSDAH